VGQDEAGIQTGEVIIELNRKALRNTDDFRVIGMYR